MESESQWFNIEEKKTESLLELTDHIFEDLVEELTSELRALEKKVAK